MEKNLLKNMIPLDSENLEDEFNALCEFIFAATKISVFNKKGFSYIKKGVKEAMYCFGQKFRPTRISKKHLMNL